MIIYKYRIIHIYKIRFNRGTRYKAGFRKRDMFLTIVIITLFHWIMALVWLIFKKVSVGDYHTGKEKLFKRCEYPISKNFRYDINIYKI